MQKQAGPCFLAAWIHWISPSDRGLPMVCPRADCPAGKLDFYQAQFTNMRTDFSKKGVNHEIN